MADNYKLCPKCKNALDNNVAECPYCGELLLIFSKSYIKKDTKSTGTKWCSWVVKTFLIVFFVMSMIANIIYFVIVSWMLEDVL